MLYLTYPNNVTAFRALELDPEHYRHVSAKHHCIDGHTLLKFAGQG
jgi:hypothetical protein